MQKNLSMLLIVAVISLAGCGGDDDDDKQSYNNFVKSLIANTSDTASPASVNDREFEYDNSEIAFNDTLADD
ncbi:MAG: hypothetical protein V4629_05725 [Pseudomonadota bacterium]